MSKEPLGRLAKARKAEGYTQESLAQEVGVSRETVNRWEAGEWFPSAFVRPKVARALRRTLRDLDELLAPANPKPVLAIGQNIDDACAWLDLHADWPTGTARKKLNARLERAEPIKIRDHDADRGRVSRESLVAALRDYYEDPPLYHAVHEDVSISLPIFSKPEWLGIDCALSYRADRFHLTSSAIDDTSHLDPIEADIAIRRLVEAVIFDVAMVNSPLYRMRTIEMTRETIGGTLSVVPFFQYALSSDLLETELIDSLLKGAPSRRRNGWNLPLRDRHIPNVNAVFDMSSRSCSGGVLALCAFARPEDSNRGPADFVLLTQERGQQVLNGASKLSVIPRGFHQPLTDFRADALIGATLRRELEEELFSRDDVDNTISDSRIADPMHPSRLSDPMTWIANRPDSVRFECTGFGLNALNGNYEVACLIVIDDPEFWVTHGGHIEANWESTGLRQYSSRDRAGVRDLLREHAWSSEGLFALIEGLRRLREIGDERIDLPAFTTSISE